MENRLKRGKNDWLRDHSSSPGEKRWWLRKGGGTGREVNRCQRYLIGKTDM